MIRAATGLTTALTSGFQKWPSGSAADAPAIVPGSATTMPTGSIQGYSPAALVPTFRKRAK